MLRAAAARRQAGLFLSRVTAPRLRGSWPRLCRESVSDPTDKSQWSVGLRGRLLVASLRKTVLDTPAISRLPNEIGTEIASYVTGKVDSIAMASTCKLFNQWILTTNPSVGCKQLASMKHCYYSQWDTSPCQELGHAPDHRSGGGLATAVIYCLMKLLRGKQAWLLNERIPGRCLRGTCAQRARRAVCGLKPSMKELKKCMTCSDDCANRFRLSYWCHDCAGGRPRPHSENEALGFWMCCRYGK